MTESLSIPDMVGALIAFVDTHDHNGEITITNETNDSITLKYKDGKAHTDTNEPSIVCKFNRDGVSHAIRMYHNKGKPSQNDNQLYLSYYCDGNLIVTIDGHGKISYYNYTEIANHDEKDPVEAFMTMFDDYKWVTYTE